ncbi:MAG: Fic family protein [Candidatus Azotimanducaceae bacterium WSBS_2022_MAG_OTU7]
MKPFARAAYFLAKINALQPLRKGNGRTQRQFLRQLTSECGHTLDWSVMTQTEMIDAPIVSFNSAP